MEKYDKQRLNEYLKELFSLCLEKGLYFEVKSLNSTFFVYDIYKGWIKANIKNSYEIRKLIERVKSK